MGSDGSEWIEQGININGGLSTFVWYSKNCGLVYGSKSFPGAPSYLNNGNWVRYTL